MKKIKNLISSLFIFSPFVTFSQNIIDKSDYFEKNYIVDVPLVINENRNEVILFPLFDDKGKSVRALGLGVIRGDKCVKDGTLSIAFENEEVINIVSFNQFNCEGGVLFDIDDRIRRLLKEKVIIAVRYKDGYSSFRIQEKVDSDYFIRVFNNLEKRK